MKKIISSLLIFVLAVIFICPIQATSSTVVGLQSNTSYYIMNISHEKYIHIYSNSGGASIGVVARDRDLSVDTAKWTFLFNSNGTVQLIDSHERALTVNSSNGVYAYTNSNSNSQRFTVVRITSTGTYQGNYLIKYGDLYLTGSSNGTLSLNSSLTSSAYWSIFQAEKGSSILYDYNATDIDTTLSASEYNTAMTSIGYTHSELTNKSAATVYARMGTDTDIMCISTHGASYEGNALAAISIDTGSSESYIISHSAIASLFDSSYYAIDNLSDNTMSSYRCVFFAGCSTGLSYVHNSVSYNLLQSAVSKGAHCVIGTTRDIYVLELILFYHYLDDYCTSNYNISEMMENIDDMISLTHGSAYGFPYVIYGDKYQYLNFNS